MKIFYPISLLFVTLCIMALRVGAEPTNEFPLNLLVPEPNCAVRLGKYKEESYAHKLANFGMNIVTSRAIVHRNKSDDFLLYSIPYQYTTIPDETVAIKIMNLERATKAANTNAKEWAIYLTPSAALVPISGRQAAAYNNGPISKSTLGECLARISKLAGLRYEVFNDRVLIDLNTDEYKCTTSGCSLRRTTCAVPEP